MLLLDLNILPLWEYICVIPKYFGFELITLCETSIFAFHACVRPVLPLWEYICCQIPKYFAFVGMYLCQTLIFWLWVYVLVWDFNILPFMLVCGLNILSLWENTFCVRPKYMLHVWDLNCLPLREYAHVRHKYFAFVWDLRILPYREYYCVIPNYFAFEGCSILM